MQLTAVTLADGEPEANHLLPSNDTANVFVPVPPTIHFEDVEDTPNS